MELITILGLCILAAAAAGCIFFLIRSWAGWTDNTRQAVITQLYAVAKTLWLALSDGKITPAELRQLFTAVLSVIAAMRGTTLDTVEQEFPAVKTEDEAPAEEPEPPAPPLRLLSVTLDSDKAVNCSIMYEDEFGFPEKLELNRKTTIYAVVEAPADLAFHVTAENARGQSRTLFHSPGPEEPSEIRRHPFVLKAPEPNGWTLNSDGTPAAYDITIVAETETYIEEISIPATITQ